MLHSRSREAEFQIGLPSARRGELGRLSTGLVMARIHIREENRILLLNESL